MPIIRIDNVGDVRKVAAGLQAAMDAVLNPESLAKLRQERYGRQAHQHVHPLDGPAVAGAVLIVGGPRDLLEIRDTTSLVVRIARPGAHGGMQPSHYVPNHVVNRLGIHLGGSTVIHRFRLSDLNREAVVYITISTVTLARRPQAFVKIV